MCLEPPRPFGVCPSITLLLSKALLLGWVLCQAAWIKLSREVNKTSSRLRKWVWTARAGVEQVLLPFNWNSSLVIHPTRELETILILTILKTNSSGSWDPTTSPGAASPGLVLLVSSELSLVSRGQMEPPAPCVKSTNQNRDFYISCNPNVAFLLSFEAAALVLSLFLCPFHLHL